MATATVLLSPDMSVSANFQALYGGFLDANIQAFGWVYTAQTGDCDPNSVAAPATNSYAGFRVYRSNDGLTNYYVRIDFGRGSSTQILVKVNVGTGVDGSGNLTGQVGTSQNVACGGGGSNIRQYMSGDAGRLCFFLAGGSNSLDENSGTGWMIGRTLDASGTPNTDGIELYHVKGNSGSNNNAYQQYLPFSGAMTSHQPWMLVYPNSSVVSVSGVTMVGFPQCYDANGLKNPTTLVGMHDQSSLVAGSILTKTLYGASRQFLVLNMNQVSPFNNNHRSMMRYD